MPFSVWITYLDVPGPLFILDLSNHLHTSLSLQCSNATANFCFLLDLWFTNVLRNRRKPHRLLFSVLIKHMEHVFLLLALNASQSVPPNLSGTHNNTVCVSLPLKGNVTIARRSLKKQVNPQCRHTHMHSLTLFFHLCIHRLRFVS